MDFDEKQMIMTGMFDIPERNIVQTQPYRPDVSLVGKDPATTATVLVFSDKDKSRLQRRRFWGSSLTWGDTIDARINEKQLGSALLPP